MSFAESLAVNPWLIWGLGLTFGFPLAMVLLSEILHRLDLDKRPLSEPVRHLRNITFPLLALFIFLEKMVGLPPTDTAVKTSETLMFISVLFALLSLANVLLFAEASAASWRARVPKLFLDLSRAFFVFVGLGMVLAFVWEADLKAFFAALGIGSLVIGLALKDTLGNLFSGIALLFEKPFVNGDIIRVGEREGTVQEMTWRSTWIHVGGTNSLLVIPNIDLTQEPLINLSRLGHCLVRIPLSFSYGDPPNKVKQAMLETAATVPGVLPEPGTRVITTGYADFAINYEVIFAVQDYSAKGNAQNEFLSRVWYAAQRHGLTIPFPIQTVYNHEEDALGGLNGVHEKLATVATLKAIPETELQEISKVSALKRFACNELVIREGDSSIPLYLIIEGEALLSTPDKRGVEREVARLTHGEYIGVVQVMLGQPSTINARALTDLLLVAIPGDAANQMLDRYPRLARDLGKVTEARRQTILHAKEGHTAMIE
jgi:small-conductance mechanosensitive channel